MILEHHMKIAGVELAAAERLAAASKWLRKEREICFYGDEQFIPTEEYTEGDSLRAMEDAAFVLNAASSVILGIS